SLPTYQNLEFSLNIPLLQQLKLKLEDVLINQRKAELRELIVHVDPDAIILDNYNFTDALLLKEIKSVQHLPLIFYQTRLSTALKRGEKTYGGIKESSFEFLKSDRILNQQAKRRRIHKLTKPFFNDEYKLRRHINKLRLSHVSLNYERCGMPSLTYLPELVLSNSSLSHHEATYQYYVGMGIEDKISKGNSPVRNILVSVGSRNFTYDYANEFIEAISDLLSVFSSRNFFLPESFRARIRVANVRFYNWSDYQNILQEVQLHITHGGINSIKDSLKYYLPMLICPMDFESDQIHNALMFEKASMAKIWNIKKDNLETISEKISELCTHNSIDTIYEFVHRGRSDNSPEAVREHFGNILMDERWKLRNW